VDRRRQSPALTDPSARHTGHVSARVTGFASGITRRHAEPIRVTSRATSAHVLHPASMRDRHHVTFSGTNAARKPTDASLSPPVPRDQQRGAIS
jgi:hypothetical protein